MLTSVTLSGNYLATAGQRFIPIGVNWVPARAAMQSPKAASAAARSSEVPPHQ